MLPFKAEGTSRYTFLFFWATYSFEVSDFKFESSTNPQVDQVKVLLSQKNKAHRKQRGIIDKDKQTVRYFYLLGVPALNDKNHIQRFSKAVTLKRSRYQELTLLK